MSLTRSDAHGRENGGVGVVLGTRITRTERSDTHYQKKLKSSAYSFWKGRKNGRVKESNDRLVLPQSKIKLAGEIG